jgi:creatinine amidohydrolase
MTPALFGDKEGSHATPGELSVVFHAHPETIRTAPDLPPAAPSADLYGAKDFRRRYPDGRIGSDPSLARADIGARLAEAASDDLARIYTRFLAER